MALSLSRGGVRVPEGGGANVRSRIRGHLNISRASGSARGGARGREVGGRVTHSIRPRLQGRRQRGANSKRQSRASARPTRRPVGCTVNICLITTALQITDGVAPWQPYGNGSPVSRDTIYCAVSNKTRDNTTHNNCDKSDTRDERANHTPKRQLLSGQTVKCDMPPHAPLYGKLWRHPQTLSTTMALRPLCVGMLCLQCIDAVGWAAGKASGL